MRVLLVFVLLFVFGSSDLYSQNKKSYKYFEKAKKAEKEGDIESSIKYLNKAIDESPEFVDASLFLADIYKGKGDLQKSLSYYESLIKNNYAPYYVFLFYGEILFEADRFGEARSSFYEYLKSPKATQKYKDKVRSYIADCEFAMKAIKEPKEFNPVNLGSNVNTPTLDYLPAISADSKSLIFTHRSPDATKKDEDFYFSVRDSIGGEWTKSKPVRGFLNTIQNEGAQTMTANGDIIYFTACERREGFGSCDLYASKYLGNGQWSKAINLGPNVNSAVWETQPSVSSDGKTLYFVRGRNMDSQRSNIFYSNLGSDGKWGKAKKLEGPINTSGKECSPFIHFDNQTLYFSSDGHPGMGNLDLFVSKRMENGTWGKPQNMGYPINSKGDEFSMIVAADGKTGYFSSDGLEGNVGMKDLYSFIIPEESRAIEIAYIRGRVINILTRAPVSASIEFSDLETAETMLYENSNSQGLYFTVLPGNKDYALNIQRQGYLVYSKNFSLATDNQERGFELNVELVPIEKGKKVKLENVFFSSNSFVLDNRSFAELNKVVEFLNNNPTVKISIDGHTDNVGNKINNNKLSMNRSKAVYKYLTEKGIAKERLESNGYGASQPIADNETESGRKTNRRTEIKIVEY